MEAIRLDEGHWDLDELVERAQAGETVDIMREGRLVARVVPGEPASSVTPEEEDAAREKEWRALLLEIGQFASTLKYDPTNSVEQMRREARY